MLESVEVGADFRTPESLGPAGSEDWRTSSARNRRIAGYPSGSLVSIDTNDFDHFCDLISGWRIDHQPAQRGRVRSRVLAVLTQHAHIGLVEHTRGYCSQGASQPGSVCFVANLDGRRPFAFRGRLVGALEMGRCTAADGYEVVARQGARVVVTALSEELLNGLAVDLFGDVRLSVPSADRIEFDSEERLRRPVQASLRVLGDVLRRPDLLAEVGVVSALENKLAENILLATSSRRPFAASPDRHQVARRARRFLLDRLDALPSIRDLCVAARSNYATLERGFKEVYGLTPRAYLYQLRLSRVRKEFLQPEAAATVTRVAMRWGFVELGRFSVQYRSHFGESPSDTLRRSRG